MIIGILGPKGSGKDTLGDLIIKEYNFERDSFARSLKYACQELFLLSDEQLHDQSKKEVPDPRWFGASPRKIMQFVGTELFRDQLNKIMPGLGKDFFTYRFSLQFKENPNRNIVITDVRFQNEVDAIHDLGGIIIKLERPSQKINTDLHPSEVEMNSIKDFDYLIKNNIEGEPETMLYQFKMIFNAIK